MAQTPLFCCLLYGMRPVVLFPPLSSEDEDFNLSFPPFPSPSFLSTNTVSSLYVLGTSSPERQSAEPVSTTSAFGVEHLLGETTGK